MSPISPIQRATDVDREPEPQPDPEQRETVASATRAVPSFGDRGQVDVVVDDDPHAKRRAQPLQRARLRPTRDVAGEEERVRRLVVDSRYAERDVVHVAHPQPRATNRVGHDALDTRHGIGLVCDVDVGRRLRDDPTGEIRDDCRDVVLCDVDRDDVRRLLVERVELSIRTAGTGGLPLLHDEPVPREPGEQLRGRRLRQAGQLDEPRTRQRTMREEQLERSSVVDPAKRPRGARDDCHAYLRVRRRL
jgi:hypothetical protein